MAKTTFTKSSAGLLPWLGLALLILIADQFTKILILGYYRLGDTTYVTSFFNVVRVHNAGAAFSLHLDRRAHDAIGHRVGFPLLRIGRAADSQFGLHAESAEAPIENWRRTSFGIHLHRGGGCSGSWWILRCL